MTKAELEIPKGMIEDLIASQMVKQIKDKEALVRTVVDAALSAKKSSYDRETVFGSKVKEMIRKVATEVFEDWLEEHKIIIRKAIEKRLKQEKENFVQSVANQITEGLAKSFYVNCHLNIEGKE